jgi:predicted hydrocarbon binding protein
MYGLVNAAVKELVCSKFGVGKWEEVKVHAGVEVEAFSRMDQYPDAVTYRLVAGASHVLGITEEAVMHAFGEFWVLYTGREGYGHLFDIAGSSLEDFLFNLDELHTRIGRNFTRLSPPSFQVETLSPEVLRLHYFSDRKGLCPMVGGLVQGLGRLFRTEVSIDHPVCGLHGADHCEFILRMQREGARAAPPDGASGRAAAEDGVDR